MSGSIIADGVTIPFRPTAAGPFRFGAALDGQQYVCAVTWNLTWQRWYLNINTVQGDLIMARPLIASPPYRGINNVFGIFQTSVVYFWDQTQLFQVIP